MTDRVQLEPPFKLCPGVELESARVDNGQVGLDVSLEMVNRDAEGLGGLLLVKGEARHIARNVPFAPQRLRLTVRRSPGIRHQRHHRAGEGQPSALRPSVRSQCCWLALAVLIIGGYVYKQEPAQREEDPPPTDEDCRRGHSTSDFDGPYVIIDGVPLEANRLTLSPSEVARVMRIDESDVRNMLRRGELRDVSCDKRPRLDPDEVIEAVEGRVRRGELQAHVFVELAALIAGRL